MGENDMKNFFAQLTVPGKIIWVREDRLYIVRISKSLFHSSTKRSKNSSSLVSLEKSISKLFFWFSKVGGNARRTILPYVLDGGYNAVFKKSVSLVKRILFVFLAKRNRWEFVTPLSAVVTSWPQVLSHRHNLFLTFSSAKNFMLSSRLSLALEREEALSFNQPSRIIQCRGDVRFVQRWEIFKNFFNRFSTSQHLQYLPHHNPCSFKSGLAMAYLGIGNDVFVEFYSGHKIPPFKNFRNDIFPETNSRVAQTSKEPKKSMAFCSFPVKKLLNECLTTCNIVSFPSWMTRNGQWGTSDPMADINDDGTVNSLDWSIMNSEWGKTI
jgi:hypothetical protein